MTTIADITDPWVVQANICDCGTVAVTILATNWCDPAASAEADPDEIVLTGHDYVALAEQAAVALADRTECRISARCTDLYGIDDPAETVRLVDPVIRRLYEIADSRQGIMSSKPADQEFIIGTSALIIRPCPVE